MGQKLGSVNENCISWQKDVPDSRLSLEKKMNTNWSVVLFIIVTLSARVEHRSKEMKDELNIHTH